MSHSIRANREQLKTAEGSETPGYLQDGACPVRFVSPRAAAALTAAA